VIHVPSDVSTIQGAIDAAYDGDTVVVDPGTYFENLNFKGKAITVKSASGPDLTIIHGNNDGEVVRFTQSGGLDSGIEGFTITNGEGGIYCTDASSLIINDNIITGNNGSGIHCYKSSLIVKNSVISQNTAGIGGGMHNEYSVLTIKNCFFSGNTAMGSRGGGMYNYFTDVTVKDCVFSENYAKYEGGGIFVGGVVTNCIFIGNTAACSAGIYDVGGVVTNCIFVGNKATNADYGRGGGMGALGGGSTITNCIFFGNSATVSGGGLDNWKSCPTVTNSIFWYNIAPEGSSMSLRESSVVTLSYSDVEDGPSSIYIESGCTLTWGDGMIDADPLFADPVNYDFHLTPVSPCVDAGDNTAPSLPATDFEGDPRIVPGDGKGVNLVGYPSQPAIVDMGADEYCLLKKQQPSLK
jgi:predicted outer membrane repeat protein